MDCMDSRVLLHQGWFRKEEQGGGGGCEGQKDKYEILAYVAQESDLKAVVGVLSWWLSRSLRNDACLSVCVGGRGKRRGLD